jgi:peptide chain release factor 2
MAIEESDASVEKEAKEEFEILKEDIDTLRIETLLSGEYDKNSAIIAIHSGAGGLDAQDWAEMLLRMYTRWADKKGYRVKTLDILPDTEAGIKNVTLLVEGENAYGYLKSEKGVHRIVRISPFDPSGKRHTSFASLDVMPELDADIEVDINTNDLRIDTYRASGAGGQHVNKTDSAIRITHIPTGIVVQCQNERSQHSNRETAMKMLMSKLIELKEREHKDKIEDLQGDYSQIAWGSQIRSYVFHPYNMVKDHRTGAEVGNVQSVMDGEIDLFMNEYLKRA